MRLISLGHRLPRPLAAPLFGDRERFGLRIDETDPSWQQWLQVYERFYQDNQKQSLGAKVNNAGYKVMKRIDLSGKRVLELGSGDLNHVDWWRGQPTCYVVGDVNPPMLQRASDVLSARGVNYHAVQLNREDRVILPFQNNEFDVFVSFYALEHLHPLDAYLSEIERVLKPAGTLVGGIPCEGGLAWGLGRYLTTRRWLRRNSSVDPDKIICWEHPNFAESILKALDARFVRQYLSFWPLHAPAIDCNLIARFVYQRG